MQKQCDRVMLDLQNLPFLLDVLIVVDCFQYQGILEVPEYPEVEVLIKVYESMQCVLPNIRTNGGTYHI